jgi:hypothetical protein
MEREAGITEMACGEPGTYFRQIAKSKKKKNNNNSNIA